MQLNDDDFAADDENLTCTKLNQVESDKLRLVKIEQTSSEEIVKLTASDGSVFFIRMSYLRVVKKDDLINKIVEGNDFSSEESEDIFSAGFAFSAERKAEDYLARCEQSRFGLTRKLLQKGFGKNSISLALDYLESKNYLSDTRFASIWLRGHCLTKFQGKIRLVNELVSRGISKNIAFECVENFFLENNLTEEEMCEKAYQKAARQRKNGEKLLKYLMDSGFSYRIANATMKAQG